MKVHEIREIRASSGRRIRLAENLAHVAAKSPKAPRFVFSRWLRHLSLAELEDLAQSALAVAIHSTLASDRLETLQTILLIAIQIELREPGARLDHATLPSHANQMLACIAAERSRRAGWVHIGKPSGLCLSIDLDLTLTTKGIAEVESVNDPSLTPFLRMVTSTTPN